MASEPGQCRHIAPVCAAFSVSPAAIGRVKAALAECDMAEPHPQSSCAGAAYKKILNDVIDRRPSGTRQRLAAALGKNRSFVSQITNPAYAVPIPAVHLDIIFEVCHFSPEERRNFSRPICWRILTGRRPSMPATRSNRIPSICPISAMTTAMRGSTR